MFRLSNNSQTNKLLSNYDRNDFACKDLMNSYLHWTKREAKLNVQETQSNVNSFMAYETNTSSITYVPGLKTSNLSSDALIAKKVIYLGKRIDNFLNNLISAHIYLRCSIPNIFVNCFSLIFFILFSIHFYFNSIN